VTGNLVHSRPVLTHCSEPSETRIYVSALSTRIPK